MKPKRVAGLAAVCARAVPAGIMASSSGRAMAAPAPLSTVRRDKCLRVKNMATIPFEYAYSLLLQRRLLKALLLGLLREALDLAFAELVARDDAEHDGLEPVVVPGGVAHDRTDRGHVAVVELAAQRERQQVFGERLEELVRASRQRRAQLGGTVDLGAVRQHAARVDRRMRIRVVRAVLSDRAEVLEREAQRIHDAVARVARGVLAVLLEACAQRPRRLAALVLFERRY